MNKENEMHPNKRRKVEESEEEHHSDLDDIYSDDWPDTESENGIENNLGKTMFTTTVFHKTRFLFKIIYPVIVYVLMLKGF